MLAVFLGLKSFRDLLYGKHVMVKVDNTTAECVIRQMATSHGSKLNALAKITWSGVLNTIFGSLWVIYQDEKTQKQIRTLGFLI